MNVGWVCPKCSLVLAPHVNEHHCDPPAVTPWVPSGGGGGGTCPGTVTITPGTTYWQGTISSGGGGG